MLNLILIMMTVYKVCLNNLSWVVVASDDKDAINKAVATADLVDAWEWADGVVTVSPYYGIFYDYDTNSIYDNGELAIADWSKLGTWASQNGFRPKFKSVRGLNGFSYRVSFFHDGTFMCVDRD